MSIVVKTAAPPEPLTKAITRAVARGRAEPAGVRRADDGGGRRDVGDVAALPDVSAQRLRGAGADPRGGRHRRRGRLLGGAADAGDRRARRARRAARRRAAADSRPLARLGDRRRRGRHRRRDRGCCGCSARCSTASRPYDPIVLGSVSIVLVARRARRQLSAGAAGHARRRRRRRSARADAPSRSISTTHRVAWMLLVMWRQARARPRDGGRNEARQEEDPQGNRKERSQGAEEARAGTRGRPGERRRLVHRYAGQGRGTRWRRRSNLEDMGKSRGVAP